MLLSDVDLRKELDSGRLVLDPWDPAMLQPSSIDVRLDRYFRVFQNSRYTHIDPMQQQDELTTQVEPEGDDPFVLHPGEFVLGSTFESVGLPDDLAGRLEGKALGIGTPVPTVAGWRTMGSLRVGDQVFGIDGRPDAGRRGHRDHDGPPLLRGVLLRRSDDHRGRSSPVAHHDEVGAEARRPVPDRHDCGDRRDTARRVWSGTTTSPSPRRCSTPSSRCRSTRTCSACGSVTGRARRPR